MLSRIISFACLIGIFGALTFGDASAAEPEQAIINARTYVKLAPENTRPIAVRAPDGSELAIQLKQKIEQELRAAGYSLDAQSGFSVRFEFHVERPGRSGPGIRLQGGFGSSGARDLGVEFEVPLGRGNKRLMSRYVLEAQAVGGNNEINWIGSAKATLRTGRDRADVLARLASGLMKSFGSTVKDGKLLLRDAR